MDGTSTPSVRQYVSKTTMGQHVSQVRERQRCPHAPYQRRPPRPPEPHRRPGRGQRTALEGGPEHVTHAVVAQRAGISAPPSTGTSPTSRPFSSTRWRTASALCSPSATAPCATSSSPSSNGTPTGSTNPPPHRSSPPSPNGPNATRTRGTNVRGHVLPRRPAVHGGVDPRPLTRRTSPRHSGARQAAHLAHHRTPVPPALHARRTARQGQRHRGGRHRTRSMVAKNMTDRWERRTRPALPAEARFYAERPRSHGPPRGV
jgi:hypothetical protein